MLLNDNFLLTNEYSKKLFFEYANKMPIIDYHCHLDPKEIYEDKNFKNITEAWLYGDHYKWRLMRANGVNEKYITGDASDYEKFLAWSRTLPKAIGNPVYAWAHLELKRFFNIDLFINEENAEEIWTKTKEILSKKKFSRRSLIRNSNVKVICTTDDPIDSLYFHDLLLEDEKDFKVFPSFRPDKALNINSSDFTIWLGKLEKTVNYEINSFSDLLNALSERINYFHMKNCRLSDHALDTFVYEEAKTEELDEIISKAKRGQALTNREINQHKTALMNKLMSYYSEKKWVCQLHLKAYRNNNTMMLEQLGSDTGFDGINDQPIIHDIKQLLDFSSMNKHLPKTILYSLNPQDYPTLLALMACFQEKEHSKIQLGSGWWFNDTRAGMEDQMTQFANHSVFGNFVGMLTDSRSFLSYPRHEYFRRVLCNLIGEWESRGEVLSDIDYLGKIVEDISYNNASKYFGFNESI